MQNKRLDLALSWPIIKTIFSMAIPILIANLLQSAYQLTDAFWVWRLWKEAVAAVWVSFPITFFVIALWSWFSMAWTTLIAQYFWAKNNKMVNHTAAQTLLMVVIVSSFLSLIWYIFSSYILKIIWVEDIVFSDALSFLRISFIWMIFVFLFAMFQSIMRWLWEVKVPLKIILFTVLLNLIIDPLFIFWYWIIPSFWVAWAAMATLVTQWLASIAWTIILLKWKYSIHIKFSDFKPDFSFIKKAFYLWLPSSIEMSARSLSMIVMTFLVTSFWTLAIASYSAWWNIFQLVIILSMWISMATSALVWQNIWAKNIDRAEKIIQKGSLLSFLFLSLFWVIVFVFAKGLIWFFVPWDLDVINQWSHFLKIVSLSFWLIWVQMSINWAYRAAWNMVTSMMFTVVSQWLLQIPLAFVLSRYFSFWLDWIWYSMLITNIIMLFVSLYVFKKWYWKKTKIIDKDDKVEEMVYGEVVIEEGIKS